MKSESYSGFDELFGLFWTAVEFRYSFNRYLARRGDANIKTLDDVINKPPLNATATSGVFF